MITAAILNILISYVWNACLGLAVFLLHRDVLLREVAQDYGYDSAGTQLRRSVHQHHIANLIFVLGTSKQRTYQTGKTGISL